MSIPETKTYLLEAIEAIPIPDPLEHEQFRRGFFTARAAVKSIVCKLPNDKENI